MLTWSSQAPTTLAAPARMAGMVGLAGQPVWQPGSKLQQHQARVNKEKRIQRHQSLQWCHCPKYRMENPGKELLGATFYIFFYDIAYMISAHTHTTKKKKFHWTRYLELCKEQLSCEGNVKKGIIIFIRIINKRIIIAVIHPILTRTCPHNLYSL